MEGSSVGRVNDFNHQTVRQVLIRQEAHMFNDTKKSRSILGVFGPPTLRKQHIPTSFFCNVSIASRHGATCRVQSRGLQSTSRSCRSRRCVNHDHTCADGTCNGLYIFY